MLKAAIVNLLRCQNCLFVVTALMLYTLCIIGDDDFGEGFDE